MTITGFVVVRLPNLNYLVAGRDRIPLASGLYYSGVDRQRWADVFDEDYYSKRCPEDIRRMAQAVKNSSNDLTGIDLSQDVKSARILLEYSNRNGPANELIVLTSPELDALKGTISSDLPVEWLGYDFVAAGEWSLIASGVFMNPDYYADWIPKLNRHGLFDVVNYFSQYVLAYERAVAAGKSEPLAPSTTGLGKYAIAVGRVR